MKQAILYTAHLGLLFFLTTHGMQKSLEDLCIITLVRTRPDWSEQEIEQLPEPLRIKINKAYLRYQPSIPKAFHEFDFKKAHERYLAKQKKIRQQKFALTCRTQAQRFANYSFEPRKNGRGNKRRQLVY